MLRKAILTLLISVSISTYGMQQQTHDGCYPQDIAAALLYFELKTQVAANLLDLGPLVSAMHPERLCEQVAPRPHAIVRISSKKA